MAAAAFIGGNADGACGFPACRAGGRGTRVHAGRMSPPVLQVPSAIQACLFDLDRVLTDTAPAHAKGAHLFEARVEGVVAAREHLRGERSRHSRHRDATGGRAPRADVATGCPARLRRAR